MELVTALVFACRLLQSIALPELLLSQNAPGRAVDYREYRSCGVSCLYVACSILGIQATLESIAETIKPASDGNASAADLMRAARQLGLEPLGLFLNHHDLLNIPAPAILHFKTLAGAKDGDHFVLFLGFSPRGDVVICDPPGLPTEMPLKRFQRVWTRKTVALCRNEIQANQVLRDLEQSRLFVRVAWGFAGAAAGVILLLLVRQTIALWRSPALKHGSAILLVAVVPLALGCSGGNARLEFDESMHDFGFVPKTGKDFEIPFRNVGTKTLAITKVRSSCQCAVVSSPHALGAGEKGKLLIRSPKRSLGPMAARVTVESNDSLGPHEVLISWFGESPPVLTPNHLSIFDVEPNLVVERTVHIAYSGGDPRYPLRILSTQCSSPRVTIRTGPANPVAEVLTTVSENMRAVVGEIPLYLQIKSPAETGRWSESVSVRISQAGEESLLTLPIELHVVGDLRARPSALVFTQPRRASLVGQKKRILVSAHEILESVQVECTQGLRYAWTSPIPKAGSTVSGTGIIEVEIASLPPDKFGKVIFRGRSKSNNAEAEAVVAVEFFAVDDLNAK